MQKTDLNIVPQGQQLMMSNAHLRDTTEHRRVLEIAAANALPAEYARCKAIKNG